MTGMTDPSDDATARALAPYFKAARSGAARPSEAFLARALAGAEAACPPAAAPARRRLWPALLAALRPGPVLVPGATLAASLVLGLGLGLGLVGEGAGLAMAEVLDSFLPGAEIFIADAGFETMFAAALEEGVEP